MRAHRATVLMIGFLILAAVIAGCGQAVVPKKAEPEHIKVGFVYMGSLKEKGWVSAQEEGRSFISATLPNVETIALQNVKPGPEAQKAFKDLVDQGCKIIISTSYEHQDDLISIAKQYPDVKFLQCVGTRTASNVSTYFGHMEQADYLDGMLAGYMTKSNKLGFVASFCIPEVLRDINAFTLGARAVNPKVEVKVAWSGTWYDSEKEKNAADRLLAEGCDVLAQNQSTEAVQQAAEAADKYAIGYNTDMHHFAPQANLTSAIWNWGPYYVKTVQSVMDGSWKSESFWGGMDSGIVDIAPLSSIVPPEVKHKIEQGQADMKAKKLVVFAGPIKDRDGKIKVASGQTISDADLMNMDWFVEGVDRGPLPEPTQAGSPKGEKTE